MSQKGGNYLGEDQIRDWLTEILSRIEIVIADTQLELDTNLPFTAQLVKNSDAEGFFWRYRPLIRNRYSSQSSRG